MSNFTVLANEKKCATCAYWQGKREPSRFISNKIYSIKAESGGFPCIAQNNQPKQGNATCPKWKKWETI
ncbi:MAG: hypothetical protein KBH94_05350 [Caldisericia bacterium]|nr:hypothetical protein [Caldisericia bacterium]